MDLEASRRRRRRERARARAAQRRRRRRVGAVLAVGAIAGAGGGVVVGAAAQGTVAPAPAGGGAPVESLARLVGDRIVTPMDGVQPSAALLRRVRAGHVAGVVLFARNVRSPGQVRRAVAQLQGAARDGGVAPLLILADQEGGVVKRFPSLPPTRAPRAMTSVGAALAQGRATARGLRARGVTVDLAPVADQTADRRSFLFSRSFPGGPAAAAARACAFAAGLRAGGVAATLKHFPGLGGAGATTDEQSVTLETPAAALAARAGAYRRCGAAPATLVMIATASYPRALGGPGPAVLRGETYALLHGRLGVGAPTISDDLETPAVAGEPDVAVRAVQAGLDLLLFAQSERAAARAHADLLQAARAGRLDRLALLAARDRLAPLRALGVSPPRTRR